MNLLLSLVVVLLMIGAFTNFVDAQLRQKPLSLAKKVKNLLDMNRRKDVIKLNTEQFKEYIKQNPRDYSIIIMFTALVPSRKCTVCKHINDEFQLLAKSYRQSRVFTNKLFLAMIDYDEAPEVFQILKISTVPKFVHFPPSTRPLPDDVMDIKQLGVTARSIAKFVQERTDIYIKVLPPPDNSGTIFVVSLVVIFICCIYHQRKSFDFLRNHIFWAVIAVLFCFAMTSGQMWNHIRRPSFVHTHTTGDVEYINRSSQGQNVFETYIVMVLNGLVFVGMVLLIESGYQPDPTKSQTMTVFGVLLLVISFSLIISVLRVKVNEYPYNFLF